MHVLLYFCERSKASLTHCQFPWLIERHFCSPNGDRELQEIEKTLMGKKSRSPTQKSRIDHERLREFTEESVKGSIGAKRKFGSTTVTWMPERAR